MPLLMFNNTTVIPIPTHGDTQYKIITKLYIPNLALY